MGASQMITLKHHIKLLLIKATDVKSYWHRYEQLPYSWVQWKLKGRFEKLTKPMKTALEGSTAFHEMRVVCSKLTLLMKILTSEHSVNFTRSLEWPCLSSRRVMSISYRQQIRRPDSWYSKTLDPVNNNYSLYLTWPVANYLNISAVEEASDSFQRVMHVIFLAVEWI